MTDHSGETAVWWPSPESWREGSPCHCSGLLTLCHCEYCGGVLNLSRSGRSSQQFRFWNLNPPVWVCVCVCGVEGGGTQACHVSICMQEEMKSKEWQLHCNPWLTKLHGGDDSLRSVGTQVPRRTAARNIVRVVTMMMRTASATLDCVHKRERERERETFIHPQN